MSKRLQVILQDPEYREIQRVARSRRMSIAEWIRQALELAQRTESDGSMGKKLEAVRRTMQHEFPAGDLDTMLAEVGSGYTKVSARDVGRLQHPHGSGGHTSSS
jgi:hypothetical protein